MPRLTRTRLALILCAGLALVIGVLTLAPVPAPRMGPGNDKLYHFVAFAALAFPVAALAPRLLVPVLVLGALYGGLIELVQPHVGRSAEWGDLAADLAGLAAGSAAGLLVARALPMRAEGR